MIASFFLALPMALTWMLVTSNISLGSFAIGLLIGLAIISLLGSPSTIVRWRQFPQQLWALFIYSVTLCRDIWLSSVDVTKRVLNPRLPLQPGILAVPTQDASHDDVIAAFSAHGITITPGELVVDFRGTEVMYVHCLDVEASSKSAPAAQTKRLQRLRRVLGIPNGLPQADRDMPVMGDMSS